jgi:hypothetical protein
MAADLDLDDDRKLCPDGSCIGLIGDDGRCKVCGRAEDGSPPPEEDEEGELAATAGDESFEDDRQLCPDGSCIGIIGSDGKCKVCGLPAGS